MDRDCLNQIVQLTSVNLCLGISPALIGLNTKNGKVSGLMELFKCLA